jgi:hypothetical protein
MLVGATEDELLQPSLTDTKAKLDLARLSGFDAVSVLMIWQPGMTAPTADQLVPYQNLVSAAAISGMRVLIDISNFGSKTTPLTDDEQSQFAQFAAETARRLPTVKDFAIGNEPNLNRFWLPQFNPDGSDAAAPAYESLLAKTYDALKAISPTINVIGVNVSPRGGDRPNTGRDTHSPTAFLTDIGTAYRASGRAIPIMDSLAIHPYEDNSSQPPTTAHPSTTTIAIADYDKLVGILGKAFDGTAQPGSSLPIYYTEFGVEAQIPSAKASLYTGVEPPTILPVPESTQAQYYRQALGMAFCQPNVDGIFLFHMFDEPTLDRWQSGIYYVDGTPKSSQAPVRDAVRDTLGGVISQCPGLKLTPKVLHTVFPRGSGLHANAISFRIACDIDCNYAARLEKLPKHSTTLGVRGRALAGALTRVTFPQRTLAKGNYRITVRLSAPLNTGPSSLVTSPPLALGPPG